MTAPALISQSTSRYIGQCIYCKSTNDLSDEHIVPHGLAGPWQLLSASCPKCCKITSAFERAVLRKYFIQVRTKLGLPTYHAKKRPKSFKFTVKINGREEFVDIPVSDITTLFAMPQIKKPGYITNNRQGKGFSITGMSLHGSRSGLEDFRAKYNLESFNYTVTLDNSFLRLLAKIAYGMVVHQYGLDAIQEAFVLPSILGMKDDVGVWVGCKDPDKSPDLLPKERVLHRINVMVNDKNEVATTIRLFADFQTPEYLVIVGRLKYGTSYGGNK